MRVPFFMYNSRLFPEQQRIDGRFQLKDVPATVLWLLGLSSEIGQSENILAKNANDDVYMGSSVNTISNRVFAEVAFSLLSNAFFVQ